MGDSEKHSKVEIQEILNVPIKDHLKGTDIEYARQMDAKLENNGENVEVREKCNQAAQSSAVAQILASPTIDLSTHISQNGERNMEEKERSVIWTIYRRVS